MKITGTSLHPLLENALADFGLSADSPIDPQATTKIIQKLNEAMNQITLDRDLLEQSLKLASEEMEEHFVQMAHSAKMASIGEMAGNIAHEINNPLQVLMITAETLRSELEAGGAQSPEGPLKKITMIETQLNRITKIVRGLKTVSRDGSQDEFNETDLRTTMTETLSLCAAKIQEKGIQLKLPDKIPDLKFWSRAAQVSQVIINLLNNACDAIELATPPPAERWIELKIESTGQHVRFLIRDSGPGVPPEIEEKVMRPFFTTKPVGRGTGLGLSVSAAIAKDHGGFLKLDRSISNSCFVFQIALNPQISKASNGPS